MVDYTTFDNAIKQYDSYIRDQLGLNDLEHGADHRAAIWGNGGEESAGFTQMHQKGGNARGGWQWDDRRAAYEAFCATNKVDPDSIHGSVWFLVHELQTTEAHALQQLKKTTTLEAATYTFMKLFERPGVEAEDVRLRWAQRALTIITAQQETPVTDVTSVASNPTVATPANAPAVDQLAQFIKQAELTVEEVIKGLLVAKGVPSFLIDFAFTQINNIDFASMIEHIDLQALFTKVITQIQKK